MLFWSRHAEASHWIPQEIGIAKEAGKPIIPVVVDEGVEPPAFIRNLKYLPAHENTEGALLSVRSEISKRAEWKRFKRRMIRAGLSALSLMPTYVQMWRDWRDKEDTDGDED